MNRLNRQPCALGAVALLCVTLMGVSLPMASVCHCADCQESNDCSVERTVAAVPHCEMEQVTATCCGTSQESLPAENPARDPSHRCQCHISNDLPTTPDAVPPAVDSVSPSSQHLILLITQAPLGSEPFAWDLGVGERAPPWVLSLEPEGGSLSIQLCVSRT